jgi:UDP-galactopyranose mutase
MHDGNAPLRNSAFAAANAPGSLKDSQLLNLSSTAQPLLNLSSTTQFLLNPSTSLPSFDFLIVGAGFAGSVLAERIATQLGQTCLIVEKRNHIGGNAYDHYDFAGVLVHDYGPHYFRTNSQRIVEYLSQFTEWRSVEYKILSWADGKFWQFPINLNTFEQLIGRASTSQEMEAQLAEWRSRSTTRRIPKK